MKKRKIIPKAPKPEEITETVMEDCREWINYLTKLSPRVKIILPNDKNFNLDVFRKKVLGHINSGDDIVLVGWPKKEEVVMLVSINSSLGDNDPLFLLDDSYLFCWYDLAFGLHYFEWDGDDDPDNENYSLRNFTQSALTWDYITKMIKLKLEELAKATPKLKKQH